MNSGLYREKNRNKAQEIAVTLVSECKTFDDISRLIPTIYAAEFIPRGFTIHDDIDICGYGEGVRTRAVAIIMAKWKTQIVSKIFNEVYRASISDFEDDLRISSLNIESAEQLFINRVINKYNVSFRTT